MADELKRRVSDLPRVLDVPKDALLLASTPDSSTETGYASGASTVEDLAQTVLGGIRYETQLDTTAKDIFGAINEAAQTGGGGGDVTKAYVDEQNALQDAETVKLKADLHEQSESLEALWKLNKGMTYDFLNKVERGLSVNPAGAFTKSLLDVRGESRQNKTNGYQLINDFTANGSRDSVVFEYINGVLTINGQSTYSGIRYVYINSDGTISATNKKSFNLPSGTYTLSCMDDMLDTTISLRIAGASTIITTISDSNKYVTFTLEEDTDVTISMSYRNNNNYNLNLRIMVEKGSVAHDWEPYTGGIPTPNPDNPREITPVEQINISVDGVVRTITPPFVLNGIGDYYDFADVDKGVWVVNTGEYTFTGNENWLTASDGAKYVTYADELAGFRFGKNSVDGLYCLADKYGCEKFRTVRESKYEALSVQLQPNYSRFWASPSVDISKVAGTNIILVRETPTETPIDSADLDYLRSLVNLDKDVSISITDQNGQDISYMLEYIIKLSEVN